jgi:hypothetical protein
MKRTKKQKYTFTLKNVNLDDVDNSYGIKVANTPNLPPAPNNTTSISELNTTPTPFFSFISHSKRHCVTMIDSVGGTTLQKTNCFWCREPFDTIPIGCPIKYVPSEVVKVCVSDITKETYTITQQVTPSDLREIPSDLTAVQKDYYVTDGCFCSFDCCLAFVRDNLHKPLYRNSEYLIHRMMMDVFKESDSGEVKDSAKDSAKDSGEVKDLSTYVLKPAPSWRLLKTYGGFMDIHEFRNSFERNLYIDQKHVMSSIPKSIPIGHVYEERVLL